MSFASILRRAEAELRSALEAILAAEKMEFYF